MIRKNCLKKVLAICSIIFVIFAMCNCIVVNAQATATEEVTSQAISNSTENKPQNTRISVEVSCAILTSFVSLIIAIVGNIKATKLRKESHHDNVQAQSLSLLFEILNDIQKLPSDEGGLSNMSAERYEVYCNYKVYLNLRSKMNVVLVFLSKEHQNTILSVYNDCKNYYDILSKMDLSNDNIVKNASEEQVFLKIYAPIFRQFKGKVLDLQENITKIVQEEITDIKKEYTKHRNSVLKNKEKRAD